MRQENEDSVLLYIEHIRYIQIETADIIWISGDWSDKRAVPFKDVIDLTVTGRSGPAC